MSKTRIAVSWSVMNSIKFHHAIVNTWPTCKVKGIGTWANIFFYYFFDKKNPDSQKINQWSIRPSVTVYVALWLWEASPKPLTSKPKYKRARLFYLSLGGERKSKCGGHTFAKDQIIFQNSDGSCCLGALISKTKIIADLSCQVKPVTSTVSLGFDVDNVATEGEFRVFTFAKRSTHLVIDIKLGSQSIKIELFEALKWPWKATFRLRLGTLPYLPGKW